MAASRGARLRRRASQMATMPALTPANAQTAPHRSPEVTKLKLAGMKNYGADT